ncbi:hypothetical protein ACSBOB_29635 [Mesorhizobium sp. ASY16-5R]|uniref:hypothetical protein n=1 Tax=Mesorhizobium sp. ASY16-5R TaxID=3445772 RepID=UPI003FA143F9
MRNLALPIFLFLSATAGEAVAQDRCGDVLREGTFQTSQYRENNYFQQIIRSRFAKATYDEAKSDTSGGFGIPLGEIVIGGDFSQSDFEKKQQSIRDELDVDVISRQEIDVALSSGDPEIVRAWRECMRGRNGLTARFEVFSAKEVVLKVEWLGFAGVPATEILSNLMLPEGVTGDVGCLAQGAQLDRDIACDVVLQLPDAFTTMVVAVRTKNGATTAYLPKRIKLSKEVIPYDFGADSEIETAGEGGSSRPTISKRLTDDQISQGWRLDPRSVTGSIELKHAVDNGFCDDMRVNADEYQLNIDYRWLNNNGLGMHCVFRPRANLVRSRWVHMD